MLLKFFLNSRTKAYLRSLEQEFGESTNGIRIELNRLEKAGMLTSLYLGNKKYFQANTKHPLFDEIHSMLLKQLGLDVVIDRLSTNIKGLQAIYITGDIAEGRAADIIDLVITGNVEKERLLKQIDKVEQLIERKIRFILFDKIRDKRLQKFTLEHSPMLLWDIKNKNVSRISK